MLLKRKRSESELGSVFTSTQRMDSGCFNFDALSAMDTARRGFFAPRQSTPSHLHSRTKKRFRDSRPSESDVYQHTLDVLYSAQRRPHELHPTPSQSTPTPNTEMRIPLSGQSHHHTGSQQRSLQSFWNIPRGSPASSSTGSLASSPASCPSPSSPATLLSLPTHCEDCGVGLGGDGDDGTMIDIDSHGGLGLGDQAVE